MKAMDNDPVRIDSRELSEMASHWLTTPINGYLGQGYGNDVKSILQTPQAAGIADGQIAKLRSDIPLARNASVNIFSYQIDVDKKGIVFEVAGETIEL
jgi:hypothetical protein